MKSKESMDAIRTKLAPDFQIYLNAIQETVRFNSDTGVTAGTSIRGAVNQSMLGIELCLSAAVLIGCAVSLFIIRSITNL